MAININVSGGVQGGSSIPTAGEMKDFSDGVKKADTMDLLKARDQPGMEPWQKDAINKELADRGAKNQSAGGANGSESTGGTQEDKDEIAKLLKKLADGTISAEELQKLAGALGVDPKELEARKGKGTGTDQGNGESQDIQGG